MNNFAHKAFAFFLVSCSLSFTYGAVGKKGHAFYDTLQGFRRAGMNCFLDIDGIGTPLINIGYFTYIKNNQLKALKEDYYRKYMAKKHRRSDEIEFLEAIEKNYDKLCAPAYNKLADVDDMINLHMGNALGAFKASLKRTQGRILEEQSAAYQRFSKFLLRFQQADAQPVLAEYLANFNLSLEKAAKEAAQCDIVVNPSKVKSKSTVIDQNTAACAVSNSQQVYYSFYNFDEFTEL